jgi:hypothetical protein
MYPNVVFTYLMSRNVVGIRELGRTTYGMLGDRRDARGRDERCVRWWDDRLQNNISSVFCQLVSCQRYVRRPSTQHSVALRSQACAFCVLFAVLLCLCPATCIVRPMVMSYVLRPSHLIDLIPHTSYLIPHYFFTSLFCWCDKLGGILIDLCRIIR